MCVSHMLSCKKLLNDMGFQQLIILYAASSQEVEMRNALNPCTKKKHYENLGLSYE